MITIILAGGEGRRLFPLSTIENPKQFIKFTQLNGSLFQNTYKRALMMSEPKDIYVVTNEKYVPKVLTELDEINVKDMDSNIIGEPFARNTLPAILAGILQAKSGAEDMIAVFPADHYISNSKLFIKTIEQSYALAKDSIVTFGVRPMYPETGYGYIEPGIKLLNGYRVKSFREKPGEELASDYIKKGFLWNSGIFIFRAGLFMEEVDRFTPEVYDAFSMGGSIIDIFSRINKGISIDIGLLEKSSNVAVVPVEIGWDDLGSFGALLRVFTETPYVAGEEDDVYEIDEYCKLVTDANGNIYLCGIDKSVRLIQR